MPAEGQFAPEEILRVLNAHEVRYIVIGGFAAAAHGVIRATQDLDIAAERSWDNAERLAQALEELQGVDATGERTPWTREVLVRREDRRVATPHGHLHMLHRVDGIPSFSEFEPPVVLRLGDLEVPVASRADVRRMKERAARPKDKVDLGELDALDER